MRFVRILVKQEASPALSEPRSVSGRMPCTKTLHRSVGQPRISRMMRIERRIRCRVINVDERVVRTSLVPSVKSVLSVVGSASDLAL